ncbi:hypothetical protein LshimejAT787_0604000 [Lyophyllum shimeji]|uniref:Uncharacterized protein n=1 Tax=Lyophyllum shimeji TaxID=47721 RepID=A0A9P3PNQ0_LYOSH|nr:hypothetical protein LshimejAT787_0604000 [Lyophyllum shimeji]
MTSATVSNFFSRDVLLKRQARSRKRPTHTKLCPSTSSINKPLPMIVEEDDEPRSSISSISRSPSPGQYTAGVGACGSQTAGVKSKRRHANLSVSDIRLAKTALVHDDSDFAQQNPALLSAPRPAPRPPVCSTPSPEPSPDPFSLKFPDGSLRFPHPPLPTPSSASFDQYRAGSESPTPSMSSSSSTSPEARSTGLPTTPSSSDDEFPSYYSSPLPSFNPRRVSIKPLVITKHTPSPTPDDSICLPATSLFQPFKSADERCKAPSPISPLPSEEHSDSEDSDSEWYNREFSQILTLCSPQPAHTLQKPRPDSICVPENSTSSPALTPTSSAPPRGLPSAQLDPAFPRRRRSRVSIPNYPPPPVPVVPEHFGLSPSTPPQSSRLRSKVLTVTPPPLRRPPPRSSIPADCVIVDEAFAFSDDSASAFSFSLYDSSPITSTPGADSPKSCYSQQSCQSPVPAAFPSSSPSTPSSFPSSAEDEFDFPVDEIEFDLDLDHSMMLPLSIPTSPIDLEADIAHGLEELRGSAPQSQPHRAPAIDGDIFTSNRSPRPAPSPPCRGSPSAGDADSRELRSRWSSSTLASVREEHARRSGGLGLSLAASAKLRAYFGAPSPKSPKAKTQSASSRRSGSVSRWSSAGAGSAIPPRTPTTPMSPMSPVKRSRHARRESDVAAIGYRYGSPSRELRRSGSMTPTVSDAGSEESASSSGSSGLRRKPIPVEMFLRSAA